MTTETELKIHKIHKMLSQLRARLMWSIIHKVRSKVEYAKDDPEECFKPLEYISNPDKWDYCGLMSNEDKVRMELLEYLIDDDMKELERHKGWETYGIN